MELVIPILIIILGVSYGRLLKSTVNWLNVDGFQIKNNDYKIEIFINFFKIQSSKIYIFKNF